MYSYTESSGTYLLFLLNTLITLMGWFRTNWFYNLVLHPYRIYRKEHLTGFFSSGFLHKNFSHYVINMAVLYVFGSNFEVRLNESGYNGTLLIIVTYLLCIIISNAVSVIYNRNRIEYTSCGASPATTGLLFCYIRLEPLEVIQYFPLVSVPNIMLIPVFVAGLVLAHFFRKEKIDYRAHLTGLLAGQLIFLIF